MGFTNDTDVTTDGIRQTRFSMADEKYKIFSSKLMPSVDKERVIGVRIPAFRGLSKKIKIMMIS